MTDESNPTQHKTALECLRTKCRSGSSLLNDMVKLRAQRRAAMLLANMTVKIDGRQHALAPHATI